MFLKRNLLLFGCGSLAMLIYRYLRYRQAIYISVQQHKKEINSNEVLFLSRTEPDCNDHLYLNIVCSRDDCPGNKLRFITNCIDSCVKSLDICIHLITNEHIAGSILNARNRGVNVRMVVDLDKAHSKSSSASVLHEEGIVIKFPNFMCMHSKMAIIDGVKLMTGSLNWTSQGMFGNWDNILITSQEDIVQDGIKYFNLVWTDKNTSFYYNL